MVLTWRSLDHTKAVSGHARTGLSVALDGSQDHLVAREARECWLALNIPDARKAAIAEVDAAIAEGATFADWRRFVRHPKNPGAIAYSMEFEGDVASGEALWLPDDGAPDLEVVADDAAVLSVESAVVSNAEKPLVQAEPDDDPAEVA